MIALFERLALRLVPAGWRQSVARDLEEERRTHAASRAWLILHLVAIGLRLRTARTLDTIRRGSPRTSAGGGWLVRGLAHDVRLGFRGVVRRPGYALAVVATLAVGIGANTAIFSVFNWILLRPVPGVHAPETLATIRFLRPNAATARFFVPYADYADLRDGIPALSGLAASSPMSVNLAPDTGDPRRIEGEIVTTNYFAVLGVRPAPGRDFTAAEERPSDRTPPVILSRRLWKTLFDSDPSALGRTLTINGHAFAIAGIAPAGFQGRSAIAVTDVWLPIGAHRQIVPSQGADFLTRRRGGFFGEAIGRLTPGATLGQAQQQATAVAASVAGFGGRRPGTLPSAGLQPTFFPGLGHDTFARDRLGTIFRLLMGAVGLLLLLACANAANLLLARGTERRREIAVCQAIGASRLRLVRQQIAEGLLLSIAAGAAGLFLAGWLTSAFDGMRILTFLPAVTGVGIDWRVCAFTLLAAASTGVLFSVAPAIVSSRVDLQASLKDGLTTSRHGRPLLRPTLVTIQVGVSVVLLVAAGLFVRTLTNIRTLDLGLRLDGLVSFWAEPAKQGYSEARAQQYFSDAIDRLRATPGIREAAFSWITPYSGARSEMSFRRPEQPGKSYDAASNAVSPGYFRTLGIPLLAGRDFSAGEYQRELTTSGVIIVNQRLAHEMFPSGGALGARVTLDYPKGMEATIVGIAGNVRGRPLTDEPEPYAYEPVGQRWKTTWGTVQVRSTLPLAETAAAIRDVARTLDPGLPPYDIEPFGAAIDRALSEQRLFARLTGVFAAIAALLAAIGIYGMMAGAVSERRREFGIRLALGANAGRVLALVVRGAVAITLCGLAAGLAAAAVARQAIASRLYGVAAFDPPTIAAACGVLALLTVVSSLIPAIRAARVDPVSALRME